MLNFKTYFITISFVLVFNYLCFGEKVLFDFEQKEAAKKVFISKGFQKFVKADHSPKFASSGNSSLRVQMTTWREGQPQWPAFDFEIADKDWSQYDRLVFDVFNKSEKFVKLKFYLVNSNKPNNTGIRNGKNLKPLSHTQVIVDLTGRFAIPKYKSVNPKDIAKIHFWVTKPKQNVDIYMDHFVLLKENDPLPRPSDKYIKSAKEFLLDRVNIEKINNKLQKVQTQISDKSLPEFVRNYLKQSKEQLSQNLKKSIESISFDKDSLEIISDFRNILSSSEKLLTISRLYKPYSQVITKNNLSETNWNKTLVATASSMTKIHPKDILTDITPADNTQISLAKNEKESFQVVVLPLAEKVSSVKVSAGDFKNENGQIFPANRINCQVVGFVKTKLPNQKLLTHNPYVGWWPDPIIPFIETVDVNQGDAQPFWIKFDAPKDIQAGNYSGKIIVSADGIEKPFIFELKVNVLDFTLPDESPLPLAVSYSHHRAEQIAKTAEPDYSPQMWKEKWQKLKFVWADFLADYYIDYDNLYYRGPDWPDYDIIDHLNKKNKLTKFNLGNIGHGPAKMEQADDYVANLLTDLKPAYQEAKERGLLDRTYIYGFDEKALSYFPVMNKIAKKLKEELPGISILTTAGYFGDFWGQAKYVDSWCPIVPNWDVEKVKKERANGNKAWWYICISSGPPFPNALIDEDAIDIRLLMGAMTAKYQPDGFLYYAINRYIGHKDRPLVNHTEYFNPSEPFTDWNPRSYQESNGDGFWVYPGPDGVPIGNIRLENFRDGLEDYAYYKILEGLIEKVQNMDNLTIKDRQWLRESKLSLVVPKEIVFNLSNYTKDPKKVNQYRIKIAKQITTVPMSN